jgi:AcrR family transcriptional regulator
MHDMVKPKAIRLRDPAATRKRILAAAKAEYARFGLGGARVDRIAARAKSNKRMLYHYFGNKDELYRHTLEDAYARFREAEAALHIENDEPVTAIRRLVAFTWDYFIANPEFLTLVNTENLHKARELKRSKRNEELSKPFVGRMQALLDRGVALGLFRHGLDPVQVLITVAAVNYYYLTNRYTGSIIYERDLMAPAALQARLAFNTDTVLRMICTTETMAMLEKQP